MPFSPSAAIPVAAHLLRFDELTPADVERWRALCDTHEDFQSALLSPEFAYVLACIRKDVRIALFMQEEELKAVLAVHLRPDGFARPLGAPFADYSGPLTTTDFDWPIAKMLATAGIAAYESDTVVDPWGHQSGTANGGVATPDEQNGHVIRPGAQSADAFLEARRAAYPKRFKNFRRLANQLTRDAGEPRLDWGRPDPATLCQLFAFKSEQFRQSGLVDLTAAKQSRQILEAVADSDYGFCVTLWVGETLIAGHFGLRVGESFHPWVAAFNPAYAAYSPGNLLILKLLSRLPETGLTSYDLAFGHDHYKKYFSNASRPTVPVFATGRGLRSWRQAFNHGLWAIAGAGREATLAARLKRRLDQIAASDFRPLHRVHGFAYAVLARALLRRKA